MWVLDYEEDIDSDMSVFHRVDDPSALPAPVYFARAERLVAYSGVLRARVMAEVNRNGGQPTQHVSEEAAFSVLGDWLEHEESGAA